MADLGVTKSHSRPYVSDDNPYSESQFRGSNGPSPGSGQQFAVLPAGRFQATAVDPDAESPASYRALVIPAGGLIDSFEACNGTAKFRPHGCFGIELISHYNVPAICRLQV